MGGIEIWITLYIQTKVRWRFRKILWPSQNIWTLVMRRAMPPLPGGALYSANPHLLPPSNRVGLKPELKQTQSLMPQRFHEILLYFSSLFKKISWNGFESRHWWRSDGFQFSPSFPSSKKSREIVRLWKCDFICYWPYFALIHVQQIFLSVPPGIVIAVHCNCIMKSLAF